MSGNNDEFEVGDVVSVRARVIEVYEGGADVSVEGGNGYLNYLLNSRLTLVERPEKKAAVELTEMQLRKLRAYVVDYRRSHSRGADMLGIIDEALKNVE